MNKQPFYHRATILFTATEPFTIQDLETTLRLALKDRRTAIIVNTIIAEECDSEPGDPADLI